jgi:hypothetical protein
MFIPRGQEDPQNTEFHASFFSFSRCWRKLVNHQKRKREIVSIFLGSPAAVKPMIAWPRATPPWHLLPCKTGTRLTSTAPHDVYTSRYCSTQRGNVHLRDPRCGTPDGVIDETAVVFENPKPSCRRDDLSDASWHTAGCPSPAAGKDISWEGTNGLYQSQIHGLREKE